MKEKSKSLILAGLLLCVCCLNSVNLIQNNSALVSAQSSRTVGLFLDDASAFQGYTLLAPKQYTTTYLIDNNGDVVNTWKSQYAPGQSAYLLPNGNLIRAGSIINPNINTGGGDGGIIQEFNWAGSIVWQLTYSNDTCAQHHDFTVLPDGDVLMLVVQKYTYEQAIDAGFNPSYLQAVQSMGYILPDTVVEVKPTLPVGGTVVWAWNVMDHLIQNYNASAANYGNVTAHPELINPNGGGNQIPVFWNHMNSITYNPTLDQIMLSVRGNSEIWIIDHSTTTAQAASHTGGTYARGGALLYRWGNPSQYGAGNQSNEMLFQQHDAVWIPTGYPGAGDILVFNNGLGRGYSSVDEFTPPLEANGSYALMAGSAYGPTNLAWTWDANPPTSLYAQDICGAQRLPNGDTLICDGVNGTLFEVTANGKEVWDYVNSVVKTGPLGVSDSIPPDPAKSGEFLNEIFKVERYAPDYAGLQGENLTAGNPIETYSTSPSPTPSPTIAPTSTPAPTLNPTSTATTSSSPSSSSSPSPSPTATPSIPELPLLAAVLPLIIVAAPVTLRFRNKKLRKQLGYK